MTTQTPELTREISVYSIGSIRANIDLEQKRPRDEELQARAGDVVAAIVGTTCDGDDFKRIVRTLYHEFDRAGIDSVNSNGFWFEREPSAGFLWMSVRTPDGGTVYLASRSMQ